MTKIRDSEALNFAQEMEWYILEKGLTLPYSVMWKFILRRHVIAQQTNTIINIRGFVTQYFYTF